MNHRTLLETYARQAARPAQWIAGLSRDQLLAHPVPGTWSIQHLLVHVLDSDLIATHRMRRMAAEELPLLIAYDETLFARNLDYDRADPALVCDLFALNRRFTAQWLAGAPDAVFARQGVHNQRGKVSVADLLAVYVDHVTHHEKFLVEKRRALGKPLA